MALRIQRDTSNIDWNFVSGTLKEVGMAHFEPEIHQKAFENSQSVVFVFDDDKPVGFGRTISDGVYQSAVYDLAVIPIYQGKGIGSMIIKEIIKATPHCNFILYAAVGKEPFYEKMGFRKMRTGMALFLNAENMQRRGFTE